MEASSWGLYLVPGPFSSSTGVLQFPSHREVSTSALFPLWSRVTLDLNLLESLSQWDPHSPVGVRSFTPGTES